MVTEVSKRLITVDEFYKMAEVGILKPTDRLELIHGEIYDVSPIGSKHAGMVDRLSSLLNGLFKNKYIVRIQNPVRLDSVSEPEPDISILNYRIDYYSEEHPGASDINAILEVSDTTIKYDREVKMSLYASYEIPVYWIIDIEKHLIEVYTKPKGMNYAEKKVYHLEDSISLLKKLIQVSDIFIK
jgi:Uma2 family endonuclease